MARVAQFEVIRPRFADPALVLRARGAQVAHPPALAAGKEMLRVLTAQQRPPAHVAGGV